jgi:hypothetical protein
MLASDPKKARDHFASAVANIKKYVREPLERERAVGDPIESRSRAVREPFEIR